MDRKFELLSRLHAVDLSHSKASLMDHLSGTYALLKMWHAPAEVCDAGLFHAVYGQSLQKAHLKLQMRASVD